MDVLKGELTMMEKHLWEVEHEYYCSTDLVDKQWSYPNWTRFLAEMGDADMDYNLLFRWDWLNADDPSNEISSDELRLYFVQQRKGLLAAVTVGVSKKDEAAVIHWLQPRFEYMVKMWQPLISVAATNTTA
jgi:hypothetical protein